MSRTEEIIDKIAEILASGHQPKMIIVTPQVVNDLIRDTNFVDVSVYGARNPLRSGEIGKMWGIPIIVTISTNGMSPSQYLEENDNPSSREKLKPKEIIVVGDYV